MSTRIPRHASGSSQESAIRLGRSNAGPELAPQFADAVFSTSAAPPEALTQVGAALAEHIDRTAERRAVIASSPELQERERTKLAGVTSAIQDALLQRGADDDSAKLVAQIATIASQSALDRWAEGYGEKDFATCLHAVAVSLRDVPAEGIGSSRFE
ncbi:hypothetical protein MMF93_13025 [Streptomyces tubbatahanensis]|uniref:MftR C-terminal domain-containing protein n=1 Tax=Streptomyces tubbatahanensis TaxID=2923272 RepID=A0ABY3XSC4_9ACTN|nr:hypothetical protein [Streptomyces tubbatahanensis]UNS97324.1 hypothetical protein MMF93_13025 [Streptomyces tubbatahanensis]